MPYLRFLIILCTSLMVLTSCEDNETNFSQGALKEFDIEDADAVEALVEEGLEDEENGDGEGSEGEGDGSDGDGSDGDGDGTDGDREGVSVSVDELESEKDNDDSEQGAKFETIVIEEEEIFDGKQLSLIKRTFPTSNVVNAEFSAKLSSNQLSFELTQVNNYENSSLDFQQIDRPQVTESHQQGAAPSSATDSFQQESENGIVDILIVIDNSGSMREEQQNLSTKLQPLLTSISNSNWQIGVITTDPRDPCMRAVIKKGDANYLSAFATAINAGTSGSGNEQGIRQAVEGLGCSTNQWVRANSSLAVLIISDEDNCSNGDCGSGAATSDPAYLTNYISNNLGRTVGEEPQGIFE